MGKFSGILLCTDFDNSLVYKLQMPQSNVEAIKYFRQNGGLFTVISGRSHEVLKRICDDARPNTYMGLFNGTVVYDPTTDTVMSDSRLDDICLDKVMQIRKRYDDFTLTVCAKEGFVRIGSADEDFESRLCACSDMHIRKYYFHREKNFDDDAYAYFCELFAPEHEATRSSIMGVEVQSKGANKGSAVLKIKELTGARLLVCIGDYENDISMIKAADIGYAVENACEPLRSVADRQTVHCKDGAIAAVIAELEKSV